MKYFYKLLLSYSLIVTIIFISFTQGILSLVSGVLIDNEMKYQRLVVRNVAEYFDDQIADAQQIIQKIYLADAETKKTIFQMIQFQGDKDFLVYPSMKARMDSFFESEIFKDNSIVDIIIINRDLTNVYAYSKKLRKINAAYPFMEYPWFRDVLLMDQNLRIIPSYAPKYIRNDSSYVYTTITSLFDHQNRTIGSVMINFDANQIERAFDRYKQDVKGTIMIFNPEGNTVYDSSGKYYTERFPYFDKLFAGEDYIDLDRTYLVKLDYSEKNGFLVVNMVSQEQLLGTIGTIRGITVWVLVLCLAVILLAYWVNSFYWSKQVAVITKAMKEVQKGNLFTRIPLRRRNDEMNQIYRNFNVMLTRLQDYIDQVYLTEIRMKEAELVALQNQINPHFLYNTLEAIRMRAILDQQDDAAKMIYILAHFLRSNVKSKEFVVKIQDEIKHCQTYLELHKIRYGDRLQLEFDFDERIMPYGIPKLTLQPLVENAILHGFEATVDALRISIKGRWEEGTILFEIEDNGLGMDEWKLASIRSGLKVERKVQHPEHLGIRNVFDRISLIFGANPDFKIESALGEGTKVRLRIPAMDRMEMESGLNHMENAVH